ncbi:hypothetical protein D1007_52279 [Hordeum vulgare]|nr:hypothetical protein D1007_52279 [Hordeum vulgare]
MDHFQLAVAVVGWMADAWANEERLPRGLFMSGSVGTVLALAVYIFRPPQGIFLNHGEAYDGTLICAAAWGLVPMVAGIWFSMAELRPGGWRVAAVLILGFTVLPLLLVLSLVLGCFLPVKPEE